MNSTTYIDNNATTPVDPEVIEAMLPYLNDKWGNPSSLHGKGNESKRAVDKARQQVASLIGASDSSEIVFTASGTESNNLALRGAFEAARNPIRLVHTAAEHSAVLEPMQRLSDQQVPMSLIPVDINGQVDEEILEQVLADAEEEILASFMWANNETGIISPIDSLAERIKSNGGIFHTDAVQAAGKIKIDLQKIPADLLTISGHKLYAPKGIGALFVRRGTRIESQIKGGHQERGRRGGTENVPFIVALGKACELAVEQLDQEAAIEKKLIKKLTQGITSIFPGAVIMGQAAERLPNTVNICFQYLEGEALLLMLDDNGVYVSTGAACQSGSIEPSHVLKAMQVENSLINGAIRFSAGRYTTEAEIDHVLQVFPSILSRLMELSPKFK